MAGTVLGKRSRATKADAPCSIATRSRKRIQLEPENDENQEPIIVLQDEDSSDVDELAGSTLLESHEINSQAKQEPRIALSPSKGNTLRTVSFTDATDTCRIPTPTTPRHRDQLSKKAPVTPRHRFTTATPLTPRTPRTPTTSVKSVYNDARQLFAQGSNPGPLIGREKERQEANEFVERLVKTSKGGCLYVSGPPGTGKSALVTEICQNIKNSTQVTHSYVNCMSVQNASDIFNILASELGATDDVFGNEAKDLLHSMFTDNSRKTVSVVVLDEVDQLLNLDVIVMYTLFEWSLQASSSLVLIGIANALDLTDRFLPRLKARNLKPQLLPFLPYTAPEIATILKARTRSLLPPGSEVASDYTPLLHPAAIQLISKKVASQNGDLRKAFDITKRALDLIEQETKEKFQQLELSQQSPSSPSKRSPLSENNNLSSPCSTTSTIPTSSWTADFSNLTPLTAPRATLSHIARVNTAAFNNGTTTRLASLNLQQKAVLCSLLALESKNRRLNATMSTPPSTPSKKRCKTTFPVATASSQVSGSAPTIRALFDAYALLCTRDNVLHALSNTEFRDVVGTLEALSLITSVNGKAGSFSGSAPSTPSKRGRGGGFNAAVTADQRRVSACVGMEELELAVEGVGSGILRAMLNGDGF